MISGRVEVISLYTFQLLASLLSPPCAAVFRANKDTISPASVWKTCLSVVYAGVPILPATEVWERSLMWFSMEDFLTPSTSLLS